MVVKKFTFKGTKKFWPVQKKSFVRFKPSIWYRRAYRSMKPWQRRKHIEATYKRYRHSFIGRSLKRIVRIYVNKLDGIGYPATKPKSQLVANFQRLPRDKKRILQNTVKKWQRILRRILQRKKLYAKRPFTTQPKVSRATPPKAVDTIKKIYNQQHKRQRLYSRRLRYKKVRYQYVRRLRKAILKKLPLVKHSTMSRYLELLKAVANWRRTIGRGLLSKQKIRNLSIERRRYVNYLGPTNHWLSLIMNKFIRKGHKKKIVNYFRKVQNSWKLEHFHTYNFQEMLRQKVEQYASPFMIRSVPRYGVVKTVPVVLYGPNRLEKALQINATVIATAIARLNPRLFKTLMSKITEITYTMLSKPFNQYLTYQKYVDLLYEVRKWRHQMRLLRYKRRKRRKKQLRRTLKHVKYRIHWMQKMKPRNMVQSEFVIRRPSIYRRLKWGRRGKWKVRNKQRSSHVLKRTKK